jgi:DNA-binding NarL/FixJ family response regulator
MREIQPLHKEKLERYFMNVQNKQQRNEAIKNAYNDGYSKSEIARNISLSVAGVSKILKS